MLTTIQISPAEFSFRADALLAHIQEQALSGVVLFDQHYILYYTGFAFIPTERPVAFAMSSSGEKVLFVPRLEFEHAQANATVDQVAYYVEYPYYPHPADILTEKLREMGVGDHYGADQDGYPWIFGYQGPSLSEMLGSVYVRVAGFIEEQMMIKSPAEVNLIRESITWANLAHVLLQRYTRVGVTETEVSRRASSEATLSMLDAIGPMYRALSAFDDGPGAEYRGQIGRNAAIPHALANNITFRPGDVLVTGAGAPMWGYNSELERTMVIGTPTPEQKQMFEHMIALQEIAFENILPGRPCSSVDRAVRAYYENNSLMQYWKHHTGHAIGLRYHEGPFLDIGDQTMIRPGMVFTVEPGLYHPELGGFRHSDTVVVTDTGIEILTYYPRDLESLTIAV